MIRVVYTATASWDFPGTSNLVAEMGHGQGKGATGHVGRGTKDLCQEVRGWINWQLHIAYLITHSLHTLISPDLRQLYSWHGSEMQAIRQPE